MKKRVLVSLCFLVAMTLDLFAHETWLMPDAFSAAVGKPVHFDLTSGLKFPVLEYAIHAERVAGAYCQLGEEQWELKPQDPRKAALRFDHSFSRRGDTTNRKEL